MFVSNYLHQYGSFYESMSDTLQAVNYFFEFFVYSMVQLWV
jgi:hypothetical protein